MRDKARNTGCSNILQSLLLLLGSTQSFKKMNEVGHPHKYRQVVEHDLWSKINWIQALDLQLYYSYYMDR